MKAKYIKTANDEIIVFPELIQHKEFKDWKPKSAGFININTKKIETESQVYYETDCVCYGESISLDLKADEEVDTALAKKHILGHGYF